MDILPLVFGVTFGIGLVVGSVYLIIGLPRPRDRVHLLFAPVAISFGFQALSVGAMSQTTTLAQYITILKYGYGMTSTIAMLSLLWFTAVYTSVRPARFLLAQTFAFVVLIFVPHLLLPTGVLTEISAIRRVTLAWGEEFTLHQGTATAWQPVVIVWLLANYGFFMYAVHRQWQRGERAHALLLGVPLVLHGLTTTVHGRLVDAGIIDSPYLGGVATLFISIPLGLQLAYDAVRTRQALREREQRLRAFVTSTREGIWMVDFDRPLSLGVSPQQQLAHIRQYARHISESNDAMARILGYSSRREVIGRYIFDVFPLSQPANEALLKEVLTSGLRVNDQVALAASHDGTLRYLENNLTPILEDGQVVRVWGTSRDVTRRLQTAEELGRYREELEELVGARTAELQQANETLYREIAERQQTEKALRESRHFIRSVLDSLPYQVVVLDESGTILEVNRVWRRAGDENGLAWERHGLGRNYLDAIDRSMHNGTTAEAAAAFNGIRAVLAGQRNEFTLAYPCHSPEAQRWFTMYVSRFVTEEARAVITHEEITERRLAENALQEREELLRQILELLPVGVWTMNATGQIVSSNPAGLQIWGGARYVGPEEFGEYKGWWVDTGQPIAAEEWAAARAISKGETSIGELIEIEAFDGSRKFIRNSAVPLRGKEQEIIGAIIVNEDITERRQVELALQQRLAELSALYEISETLATLSDLPQGLPRVAEMATQLFRVDSTHIVLSQKAEGELILAGFDRVRGQIEPEPVDFTLSETPLLRQVLQKQKTLVVTAGSPMKTTVRAKAFLKSRNIQGFMVVPLLIAGETVGVMSINSAQMEREFAPEEIRLAETIAADVAAAVANLHFLGQTQENAALEERQRIASDLHDSVTQTIYSISIVAQVLVRMVQNQELAEAESNALQLRLMTLGALAQMRALLFELRPSALAEAKLAVLLQQLGDVLTGRFRLPVDLVVNGDVQPPAQIKIAFYRIAQEAFNNIAKHTEATQVTVGLRGSTEAVELTITDDGRGFDTTADFSGQMGLQIMQERADDIGARLQVDSQPGRGTQITLSWKAR